jgi:hypothetical protein
MWFVFIDFISFHWYWDNHWGPNSPPIISPLFPMISPLFPYDVLMISLWFPYSFPIISLWIPYYSPITSLLLPIATKPWDNMTWNSPNWSPHTARLFNKMVIRIQIIPSQDKSIDNMILIQSKLKPSPNQNLFWSRIPCQRSFHIVYHISYQKWYIIYHVSCIIYSMLEIIYCILYSIHSL